MYIINRAKLKAESKDKVADRSFGFLSVAAAYILLTDGISNVLRIFVENPINEVTRNFTTVMNQLSEQFSSGQTVDPDLTPAYAAAARTIQELLKQPMKQTLLFVFLLLFLYQMVVTFGFHAFCLRSAHGERLEWTSLLDGLSYSGRVLVLTLLTYALVCSGFFFFVLPGLMAFYGLRFAPYLLAEHPDWSAMRCMGESWKLTRGHKMELFSLDVSFIGWDFACFIALNLGHDVGAFFNPVTGILMSLGAYVAVAPFYLAYKDVSIIAYMDEIKKFIIHDS